MRKMTPPPTFSFRKWQRDTPDFREIQWEIHTPTHSHTQTHTHTHTRKTGWKISGQFQSETGDERRSFQALVFVFILLLYEIFEKRNNRKNQ